MYSCHSFIFNLARGCEVQTSKSISITVDRISVPPHLSQQFAETMMCKTCILNRIYSESILMLDPKYRTTVTK